MTIRAIYWALPAAMVIAGLAAAFLPMNSAPPQIFKSAPMDVSQSAHDQSNLPGIASWPQRPMFSSGSEQSAQSVTELAVDKPSEARIEFSALYVGYVDAGSEGKRAIFLDPQTDQSFALTRGEFHNGWHLKSITPWQAELTRGDEHILVRLFDDTAKP